MSDTRVAIHSISCRNDLQKWTFVLLRYKCGCRDHTSRSSRAWLCVWTCAPPGSLHLCILCCSWCTCRACPYCVDAGGTGKKNGYWKYKCLKTFYTTAKCSVRPVITNTLLYEKKTKFFHTCKFESCVKDFSQPGWVHLYGRSPVWILNKKHKQTHTCTYMDSYHFHGDLTWPQKDTEAGEKPKTSESLTCCAAEGDWAVWSSFGRRSRCRVSLRCGCGHVGPGS